MRAEDITASQDVRGLIAFIFACFGAGMPARDSFAHLGNPSEVPVGPASISAPLPQRLLGHPNGGALAVIGHVDRALPSAFYWPQAVGHEQQLAVFRKALWMIMQGHRVGYALEFFNQRYAELSTIVSEELDNRNKWKEVEINPETDGELATYWLANNDARSYVILGDPAVRVAVGTAGPPSAAPPPRRDQPVRPALRRDLMPVTRRRNPLSVFGVRPVWRDPSIREHARSGCGCHGGQGCGPDPGRPHHRGRSRQRIGRPGRHHHLDLGRRRRGQPARDHPEGPDPHFTGRRRGYLSAGRDHRGGCALPGGPPGSYRRGLGGTPGPPAIPLT